MHYLNSSLRRAGHLLRHGEFGPLAIAAVARLLPLRAKMLQQALRGTRGRIGLEIGGPSKVFCDGGPLPIYSTAGRVDNVNFANETPWESNLRDGGDYFTHRGRLPGRQRLRHRPNAVLPRP